MKPKRRVRRHDATERDRRELERFATYLRLCAEAKAAGCTRREAEQAIYPDVYEEEAAPLVARRT